MVPLNGDAQVADGLSVMLTPGHSRRPVGGGEHRARQGSHHRLLLQRRELPPGGGSSARASTLNAIEAYESAKRAREAADIIIPLHDLAVGRQPRIPE